jgi:glutamate 5-kinase
MRGTIVIHANAGHALRHRCVAVSMADVLDCMGDFRAGDRVHVVVRGSDGGQGVIATGIVRCDAAALKQARSGPVGARNLVIDGDDRDIVIAEQDLKLLWPATD